MTAFLLPTLLAGCTTYGSVPVPSVLPPLPYDLAADCDDPGVRGGKSAITEIARNRKALAECKARHRDTVGFYDGLRAKMGAE